MDSHKLAVVVRDAINDLDHGIDDIPDFNAVCRLRAFKKHQDIPGLSVIVIPIPPDTQIVDRSGGVEMIHQVLVCVFDRMMAGSNDPDEEFAWSEKRTELLNAFLRDIAWNTVLASSDSVLSEAEIGGGIFDGVDVDTVFASAILFSFETSE